MKAGWYEAKIGDLGTVQSGSGFPTKYQGNAGKAIPFYKVSDMNIAGNERAMIHENNSITEDIRKKLGANIFPKGSVIFPKIGGAIATNKKRLTTRDCCVDNNVMGMIPQKETLDSDFLFYFFLRHDLSDLANEAHLPSIKKTTVENMILALPKTLCEQRRIVCILDDAFDGIATAKTNAEKNRQNARALFESHLKDLFVHPTSHPAVPIGQVAEVFDGPHSTPKTVDKGPIFLGISALQDGRVNLKETRHVTPADFRQWTRRVKPQTDDIVFSYETRLGQVAIIPEGLECCLGRRMGLVRLDRKRVDPRFFVYQYISPPFREFLGSRTVRGATVDRIALKEFPSFPITLPPLVEQERIAGWLDSLQEQTQRLAALYQQKLATLDQLKKSLLHQAFSGQL